MDVVEIVERDVKRTIHRLKKAEPLKKLLLKRKIAYLLDTGLYHLDLAGDNKTEVASILTYLKKEAILPLYYCNLESLHFQSLNIIKREDHLILKDFASFWKEYQESALFKTAIKNAYSKERVKDDMKKLFADDRSIERLERKLKSFTTQLLATETAVRKARKVSDEAIDKALNQMNIGTLYFVKIKLGELLTALKEDVELVDNFSDNVALQLHFLKLSHKHLSAFNKDWVRFIFQTTT